MSKELCLGVKKIFLFCPSYPENIQPLPRLTKLTGLTCFRICLYALRQLVTNNSEKSPASIFRLVVIIILTRVQEVRNTPSCFFCLLSNFQSVRNVRHFTLVQCLFKILSLLILCTSGLVFSEFDILSVNGRKN